MQEKAAVFFIGVYDAASYWLDDNQLQKKINTRYA